MSSIQIKNKIKPTAESLKTPESKIILEFLHSENKLFDSYPKNWIETNLEKH